MIRIEVWGVGHAIIYQVSQTNTITVQLNHGLQKPPQILIILGVFHSTGPVRGNQHQFAKFHGSRIFFSHPRTKYDGR